MSRWCMMLLLTVFSALQLYAQKEEITVTGTVKGTKGETLVGVNIVIENQPGLGVVSDIDGNYKIKADKYATLVASFIGYKTQRIAIAGKEKHDIVLEEEVEQLDEVSVVAAGVQRKATVVGAITTVDVEKLKTSGGSQLSNTLAGNVAGIIAMQRSGEPGANYSEFWIRGISTFGANSSALVLVDGIERDFNELNAEDIESFSVLKDASATAIYGQRGANGVVLVTTKRGKEGKVKINVKGEFGISTPSRMPEYVDGLTYTRLANEARLSRYQDPMYSEVEMKIIEQGLDPDIYPNVDWQHEILKNITTNHRAMINFSGGGSTARYFVSGGYYNEAGMYKHGDLNDYDTNVRYKRFNFRSNVDINLTKTTILEMGVGGWIVNQNKPGSNSDAIWTSMAGLTPLTVPVVYSNGLFPTYGTSNDQMNPYVLLTQTGYKTCWENKMETNVALNQDLDFITKGLKFYGRFSYDAYNTHEVHRLTSPDLYHAEKQRDRYGDLVLKKVADAQPLSPNTIAWGDRRYYTEANLNYNRVFGEKHRVGGLLLYYQQEYTRTDGGTDPYKIVPYRNMALSGRATYSYDDRYMVEFNFGYTGSENFEKNSRFGFFPAIAMGWMASNEKFIKDYVPWIDQLKLRYSYGEVGNDKMDARFPYRSTVDHDQVHPDYQFGDNAQTGAPSLTTLKIGARNLTWEVAKKHNFGLDLGLFDKFDLTVDVFRDNREKIFMVRQNLPAYVGMHDGQLPWANVGRMRSTGMDGTASYSQEIGEVTLTARGNFTFSRTKVLEYDEAVNTLDYQKTQGYRWGQTKGLQAIGLFKDERDIANSPRQTFGDVLPGDIKYKDVNGDGLIDKYDILPIGFTNTPEFVYGFGVSVLWKNLDVNILFQGSGNCDFMLGGTGVFPFAASETGNVLQAVAKDKNRWIPAEVSGTTATENPDATFPRLTYGTNPNNTQASTFWLRNSRYLRFKNLEIGYTVPRKLTRKLRMETARFYLLGNNLFVLSPFKWWDPEIASGNGATYPIQRTVTLGLTVNF